MRFNHITNLRGAKSELTRLLQRKTFDESAITRAVSAIDRVINAEATAREQTNLRHNKRRK